MSTPATRPTSRPASFGRTILLVRDEDEAAAFYRDAFGFVTLHDSLTPDGQRFLHIGAPDQRSAAPVGLWLLRAGDGDDALVGRQAGGQPLLVLYTDDCRAHCQALETAGVLIRRPAAEAGGAVFAHVLDLYGNEIVLVQLAAATRVTA